MLLLAEGYDNYNSRANMRERWGWNGLNADTFETTDSRFSGKCVRMNGSDDMTAHTASFYDGYESGGSTPDRFLTPAGGPIHAAFWMRIDSIPASPSGNNRWFGFRLADNSNGLSVRSIDGDATKIGFSKYNDSTIVSSVKHGWSTFTWHHVEVATYIHETSGWFKVWVDGILILDYSGSTSPLGSGSPQLGRVSFSAFPANLDTYYDDIVVWDETGTDFAHSRLAEHRIDTLWVNGNGDANELTASPSVDNHLNVDETPFHDSGTTHNHTASDGVKELYAMENLSRTPRDIYGVTVHAWAQGPTLGTEMTQLIKSGGTEISGNQVHTASSYGFHQTRRGKNQVNNAWSKSDIDSIQCGVLVNNSTWPPS